MDLDRPMTINRCASADADLDRPISISRSTAVDLPMRIY